MNNSQEFSEAELPLSEPLKPSVKKQKHARRVCGRGSEPIGIAVPEIQGRYLLHDEQGLECWCRPTVLEENGVFIVVHNCKGDADA